MNRHLFTIGIRREDKNRWERRVPLTPKQVGNIIKQEGLAFAIQPSTLRIFDDEEYRLAGTEVREDISDCGIVFGVKEMPEVFFRENGTYAFFAHVIKGQVYNMPMLARMMELGCNLIDYEKITDDSGRRLVFFGRYAGIAGMVDTLVALGKRFECENMKTPFLDLKPAYDYAGVDSLKAGVAQLGARIKEVGLPDKVVPLVFGIAGYGHVARGALEVLDALGTVDIKPEQLSDVMSHRDARTCYRTVFREEHMVEPEQGSFDLKDYYQHPDRYRPVFEKYLPYLTVLVNSIFWNKQYPRLVRREWLREEFGKTANPRLRVIGDISCDIQGAIEATLRHTDSGSPFFVYDPQKDSVQNGVTGQGIVIMAVDNLPCELPADSSDAFGAALFPFIPAIARADYRGTFDKLELPGPVRRALILHQGKLTPEYKYISKFLNRERRNL
ncbi:hypothetical protein CH330_02290 [candidate division WOR-3 bacterium JGI_Cruoil_03_51_56]|uniref:Alanine dehydrogenase/pyridine nucleotide transhydrogenase N-terminal domain-containing protein n=1 Tax=candidate division WOR-3 bacterium JGI_Cruoil_03_51_56 TaxID=1973747 RepID=A0A235BWN0_UNCW3|nr:MAG: hypothetical protein CH330_02290 [candidate division WOR-3 bacterium JGI_Cruoil_03_51_56]